MAKRKSAHFPQRRVLEELDKGKRILEYRKNHIIFAQGDPADAVFYIREEAVSQGIHGLPGVADWNVILERRAGSRGLPFG